MRIDLDTIRKNISSGLPAEKVEWINLVDFDFGTSFQRLRSIPEELVADERWADLHVFGQYWIEGGSIPFLCISEETGCIYAFEPEGQEPRLLNTSMERFIASFHMLDGYLGSGEGLPNDIEDKLFAIDPEGLPNSEWTLFVSESRERSVD